jgi:hypothetical protein
MSRDNVIALAIAGSMSVPALDLIREITTEEEYQAILLAAAEIVKHASGAGLEARIVGLALAAAAAMYSEGLTAANVLQGRGPGSN